ncbi:MAG: hypothetical protein IT449_07860 [Phycisphaerales bacterium]|nr:hypothetical protein [Phycisphaerales bacterium]
MDEAVAAGKRALDPHLRSIVSQHVGADKAIKSMEEFLGPQSAARAGMRTGH